MSAVVEKKDDKTANYTSGVFRTVLSGAAMYLNPTFLIGSQNTASKESAALLEGGRATVVWRKRKVPGDNVEDI